MSTISTPLGHPGDKLSVTGGQGKAQKAYDPGDDSPDMAVLFPSWILLVGTAQTFGPKRFQEGEKRTSTPCPRTLFER